MVRLSMLEPEIILKHMYKCATALVRPEMLPFHSDKSFWGLGGGKPCSHHCPQAHRLHLSPCCSVSIFRIQVWVEDSPPEVLCSSWSIYKILAQHHHILYKITTSSFPLLPYPTFFLILSVLNKKTKWLLSCQLLIVCFSLLECLSSQRQGSFSILLHDVCFKCLQIPISRDTHCAGLQESHGQCSHSDAGQNSSRAKEIWWARHTPSKKQVSHHHRFWRLPRHPTAWTLPWGARLSDLAPARGISHSLHHSSYVWWDRYHP